MSWSVVFFVASGLALYVVVGYPLLLGLRARMRTTTVEKDPNYRSSVSIVIPVHNGERFIRNKLLSVLALDYPPELTEVIVVSDGSTDGSVEIAASFSTRGVRLIEIPRGGKCAALNAGIAAATGEILLLTDVRQIVESDSLGHLVSNFADGTVGAVSGHLRIRSGDSSEEADIGLYWKLETWIRDRLSRVDSMLGATGPFYALRRDLAVEIPEDILLDDMYLPLSAFRRGYRLIVDGNAVAWDVPTTRGTEFDRKVRTLGGNLQLLAHYPWLLGPRNRMMLDFLSYKVGRLALPLLLILTLTSSVMIDQVWARWAVGAQLAAYGLALVDPWVPAGWRLKRLTSPMRTFFVMMLAAVRAWTVLLVPARRLWKVTGATPEPRAAHPPHRDAASGGSRRDG